MIIAAMKEQVSQNRLSYELKLHILKNSGKLGIPGLFSHNFGGRKRTVTEETPSGTEFDQFKPNDIKISQCNTVLAKQIENVW